MQHSIQGAVSHQGLCEDLKGRSMWQRGIPGLKLHGLAIGYYLGLLIIFFTEK